MQQEAQDAQTALAEMNAEILAEQGNTAAADKLKLQNEVRPSALTDIGAANSPKRGRPATRKRRSYLSTAMIAKAKELYALKKENLTAEIAGNDKTTQATRAATESANKLTSALKQSAEAAKILNGADLSGLVKSSGEALSNFKAIKGLM
jgi:hypothetical protein